MGLRAKIRGLYAITPDNAPLDAWQDKTLALLEGGVRILQYRAKRTPPQQKMTEALVLQRMCKEYGAQFIINDDIELALDIKSDGLHLGRHDTPTSLARQRFPGIIGVSCYADLERAKAAVADGADYLAFGAMAVSPTKPTAPLCPIGTLGLARALNRPIVAIGGITRENAGEWIVAGADSLAVISALYDAPDPKRASELFCALWSHHES